MKEYNYKTKIIKNEDMDAGYIIFPYDVKKEFGMGRVKVRAMFDDVLYEGSIVNMGVKNDDGSVCYIIGIPRIIREQLNKSYGDEINVSIKKKN